MAGHLGPSMAVHITKVSLIQRPAIESFHCNDFEHDHGMVSGRTRHVANLVSHIFYYRANLPPSLRLIMRFTLGAQALCLRSCYIHKKPWNYGLKALVCMHRAFLYTMHNILEVNYRPGWSYSKRMPKVKLGSNFVRAFDTKEAKKVSQRSVV